MYMYICICTSIIYIKHIITCICIYFSIDTNECETTPCQNSGVCMNNDGSFTCDCRSTGRKGPICENGKNDHS